MIKSDKETVDRWLDFIGNEYGSRYGDMARDIVYNWKVRDFNSLPLHPEDRDDRGENEDYIGEIFLPEHVMEVARRKLDFKIGTVPFSEQRFTE